MEVRQLVRGSYRVLFRVHRARVEVLHVRHAARRPGWTEGKTHTDGKGQTPDRRSPDNSTSSTGPYGHPLLEQTFESPVPAPFLAPSA